MTYPATDFHSTMMQFNSKIVFGLVLLFWVISINTSEGNPAEKLYKQGFNLSIEGKTQSAIQAYLKALEIKRGSAETHHALGVLYFESGSGIKAIDHFKKAELLYKDRNDKKANLNLTIVRTNLEKAYKKLGLNPDDFIFDALLPTEGKWEPSGIGFLIGDQGHLFTSASSIKGAKKIRIRFPNGKTRPAKLVREFIVYKIAILKLTNPVSGLSYPLSFEDNPHFKEGNSVYAMDFSKLAAANQSLSKGKILKEYALENSDKVIQINLEVKKGENGGPLFNENGKLIGLILSKPFAQQSFSYLKDSPGKSSFAIKSPYLKKILSGLIGFRKQGNDQPREANLNSGINVNKISREAINNFIFLETSN